MNEYFYIDFQTEILLLLPPLLDSLSLSTLPPIIIPVFFSLFSFFFLPFSPLSRLCRNRTLRCQRVLLPRNCISTYTRLFIIFTCCCSYPVHRISFLPLNNVLMIEKISQRFLNRAVIIIIIIF